MRNELREPGEVRLKYTSCPLAGNVSTEDILNDKGNAFYLCMLPNQHCVTLHREHIFDATLDRALLRTMKSLQWCVEAHNNNTDDSVKIVGGYKFEKK